MKILALALTLVLFVAVACGESSDSDPTDTVENFATEAESTVALSDETTEAESTEAASTPTGAPEESTTQGPTGLGQELLEGAATVTPLEEVATEMQWEQPPEMQLEEGADYWAKITTNKGEIVIDLLEEDAPATVNNFVFLSQQGYYSDVVFHRVINQFMIQSGDPTGTGAGGPGYQFEDEPVSRDYVQGTLAMANAGPDTNGSQFFITHVDVQLDPNYTIFGLVSEGQETVDAIASIPVGPNQRGEMSVPQEPIYIESVEIFVK